MAWLGFFFKKDEYNGAGVMLVSVTNENETLCEVARLPKGPG